jgi:hypothetical protein
MAQTVQQKDTTFTKIFVGGLPYHTTDESLRQFFEQFGDIEEAVVITDRQTGKSRGYGFVTMSDRAAAERACKEPNPIIDGRKANVNLAYLGAKPRGIQTAFPFGLKAGIPGVLPSQFGGLPQYLYPSATYAATPGMTLPMVPNSPMSPTAAHQYLADFTAQAYQAQGQLSATGYEAYPYTTAGYVAPTAYSYASVPQQFGPFAAYQPQQIQERLQ